VDGSDALNAEIVEQEQIDGFPTIAVYKNGIRISDYNGDRTNKSLVEYLHVKAGPAARKITSYEELTPFIDSLNEDMDNESHFSGFLAVVLGIFPTSNKTNMSAAMNTFLQVANRYELARFYYTLEPQQAADQTDSLVLYSGMKDERTASSLQLTDETTEDELINFILKNSIPSIVTYSSEIRPIIQSLPFNHHVLLFYNANDQDTSLTDVIEDLSIKFKGRLLFMEIESEEHQVANFFGLKTQDMPQLIIVDMENPEDLKKYIFYDCLSDESSTVSSTTERDESEEEDEQIDPDVDRDALKTMRLKKIGDTEDSTFRRLFSVSDVEAFLSSFLGVGGHLRPSILTEEVDSINIVQSNSNLPYTHVENIVAWHFEDKVVNTDAPTDILVYFHASWCGHCKSLEPVILDVAKHFHESGDKHFKLFRIDGAKNEVSHPGLRVLGFPAIYLFPALDKNNPIEYDGDRTVEALIDFITEFRSGGVNWSSELHFNVVEAVDSVLEDVSTDSNSHHYDDNVTPQEEQSRDDNEN